MKTFIVKDKFTHQELYRGTEEMCIKYIAAFGLCYAEEL